MNTPNETQPAFADFTGLYAGKLPIWPTTEQLADDALLQLSKLRDRLVFENANLPACRVDEAMEITLAAARKALGIEIGGAK